MASALFTIRLDTLRPSISRLMSLGKDTTPVMRAMGTTFKSITEGNFGSSGASYRPSPWKPKYGGAPSILQKSGLMVHAFFLQVTKDRATLSNPTKYAAIHQFGGTIQAKGKALRFYDANGAAVFRKTVTIPARPFYPVKDGSLTPAAAALIERAGARAVERVIAA